MERTASIATCKRCQDKFDKRGMIEGPDHVLYCTDCFKNLYCSGKLNKLILKIIIVHSF